jgi:hypothetical protein
MTEKKTIGAWKKQTGKGEVINFSINGVKYSMWANTYKKEEKHPDYNIVVNDYVPPTQDAAPVSKKVQDEITDLPF